jgi:magnesium-transporting ATPase (P-type)
MEPETPWHASPVDQVLASLEARREGLSEAEAASRLARFGENRLGEERGRGPLERLLAQFHNLLIYVLMAAGVITAALDHWIDSAVIFSVVIVNALIGFLQEGKAEKALAAIRGMLAPQAQVLRDGHRQTVAATTLVPGDLVLLRSGDKVPADLRLLSARNFATQEAALTGEALPVDKSPEPAAAAADLGDRHSMAYAGTLVAQGQATGIVVATGRHSELGRITELVAQVPPLTTPLLRQMADFARTLTIAILVLAVAVMGFGVFVHGLSLEAMFLAAVGLAVAAIPEGLPAILTITLAVGVTRMARRNAIIRRLPAVETLGAVTVICSDKTGTLTRNELIVQQVVTAATDYQVSGVGYGEDGEIREVANLGEHPDLEAAVLAALRCNDAELNKADDGRWRVAGNPTDGALLALAAKARLDISFQRQACPRSDVIPFESEHKYMASLHHDHAGRGYLYVKGAPERILELCRYQLRDGHPVPLDTAHWQARTERLAGEGQRVLAIAYRPMPREQIALDFKDIRADLVLIALFGITDPPRKTALAAVEDCRSAGIAVKMITGDHAATARAIARYLGLGRGAVLTGRELDAIDDQALVARAQETDVFARTTPEHKLRLVRALQAGGAVVAMTGDGVNDAPALRRADVGIAMGQNGTEAAKEAAEMVLADDNFASIAHAVEEGRTVYDNLKKAILFILPTNGGEALTILAAVALGRMLPITPVQILWVNMATAITLALALAFERAEPDIMRRAPRRADEPLLSGFLVWRIVFVSLVLLAGTFGLFLWQRAAGAPIEVARGVAVNALVMGEIAYLFNSRRSRLPGWSRESLFGSRIALIAVAVVVVLQLAFTYLPVMQLVFAVGPLDLVHWAAILGFGLVLFAVVELEKLALRRFFGKPAATGGGSERSPP